MHILSSRPAIRLPAAGAGLALLLLAAGAAAASPVHAAPPTIAVDTLTDGDLDGGATTCVSSAAGGHCTLRAALALNDSAGGGATVTVGLPGQIGLTLGELVIGSTVTITGEGQSRTSVRGDGSHRVLAVAPDAVASVSGLAIVGGSAVDRQLFGGGILNVGSLTLTDVLLQSNKAGFGGGIADAGTLVLKTGVVVDRNEARLVTVDDTTVGGIGGGVAEFGRLTSTGGVFSGNIADAAGGDLGLSSTEVVLSEKTVTTTGSASLTSAIIRSGVASTGAGAFLDEGTSAAFVGTAFFQDQAASGPATETAAGGAIANVCGTLTLANTTLDKNLTELGLGNALAQECGATGTDPTAAKLTQHLARTRQHSVPTVDAARFAAGRRMAAVRAPSAPAAAATLDFVTIAGDATDNQGGPAAVILTVGAASSIRIHDTIIANRPTGGGVNCAAIAPATITSLGYNLEDAADCTFNATGDQGRTDPRLGALADNGGPTPTMALSAGTPAVDAADPHCDVTTDQRGVTRPLGARCDIGAFELQVASTPSPSALPAPPVTGFVAGPPTGLPLAALLLCLLALVTLAAAGTGLQVRRRERRRT